ncbi:MAG TPA: enolase C-terminal domain-like protein, partial [Naasia sp.]
MKVEAVELHRVGMPLVRPFETSFGRQTERDVLLLRVRTDGSEGWGECVAMTDPVYSSEYVDGCAAVLERYLVPAVLSAPELTADGFAGLVRGILGHRMAKAALEAALLDAELRSAGTSLARRLGAVRDEVDCGVSVGIAPGIPELLEEVAGYVAEGYRRIKLKIKPGWDLEPVAAVRAALPAGFPLQVDANTAYALEHVDRLRGLDEFDLLLIEQPFPEEDVGAHAVLASRIRTPVCLDESITDAVVAADAVDRGAT